MKKILIFIMILSLALSVSACSSKDTNDNANTDSKYETGPLPGMLAPDFELEDILKGENLKLSSLQGKAVLLVFWTST
jgi:cytochrome oxidase Cu insertion factor (SCO1/SenC/PrrC family)